MNFRNISGWSIRNPIVPIVLFIALMAMGVFSFMRMDVQNDPDIEFPMVIVSIAQPGAAPTEIENQITQRIESAVRTLAGVASISSTANEGNSQTMVEFQLGTDINQAVADVKNAVDQARSELPDGILEPQVIRAETSSDPIAYFAVDADDMTLEQLSWFIDDTVAKRLLTIEGLVTVQRGGGVNREILVTLDPARMQASGVTAGQVNQALRGINVNSTGGRAEIGGVRQSVRVLGNAATAYELSQTDIALGGGRTVKLADIATVSDAYGEITSKSKFNGKPVVTFAISRGRGASDVTVYDAAVAELDKLEEATPGVTFRRLITSVTYTKDQYRSSMAAMVEGAILAVVVVFLFLRDWRATMIAALAIPLSAIPTFWFMDLLGFTLNTLSLLALGLVAGILVDDAIVEIENIVRHMRMGKTAYQASIDAADEIGLAVVATTFSIVAVFLPVGLMPGVSGEFFKNFGLTVVVSVLMSLAVARMITPMVAAYFLKAHGHAEHGEGPLMDRYMGILHWSLDSSRADAIRAGLIPAPARPWYYGFGTLFFAAVVVAFVAVAYLVATTLNGLMGTAAQPEFWRSQLDILPDFLASLLGGLLSLAFLGAGIGAALVAGWLVARAVARFARTIAPSVGRGFTKWYTYRSGRFGARFHGDHRVWMVGIGAVALLMTAYLMMTRPGEFFPTTDQDFSTARVELVPGTTLDNTEAVSARVNRIIAAHPDVDSTLERISEGNARIQIMFKDRSEREKTSIEIEAELTREFQKLADARVTIQSAMSGGGGGTGRPISVMLSGSDPVQLDAAAARLVEQMKGVKQVVAPRISADMRRPEVIIRPRLDLAASLGVTTQALSQAIRSATIGEINQNAAKFSLADRQVPIRVRLPEEARRDIANIQNLPVPTASGGTVPLSRVAEISMGSGPTSIQRYNQKRRVFIGADLAPGVVKSEATEAINQLPIMQNLPAGVSNDPFGEDRWQQEMIDSVMVAVPTGILLVFAVLVLLYHRVVSPLVNMGSLFLAPFGGMIALVLSGDALSMPVLIGVLMLFGIVAKNSILLIDFAIEAMALGVEKFDAIIDAGHKRAQPIVMTTVAMTAGMVPTAMSLSGDGAWRAPMGTVVIGGLIVSTALTLLIVPAAFSLADGLEKRIGPKLRRGLLTYNPEDRLGDASDPAAPLPAE
jgi:multidrug efflux pump subunit AcrB